MRIRHRNDIEKIKIGHKARWNGVDGFIDDIKGMHITFKTKMGNIMNFFIKNFETERDIFEVFED